LVALHQVVRLRLWSGGRESAFELSDALRDTQPTRAEDAYGKMFGLLLLGAHDETIEAWRTLRDADIWEEGSAVESSMCAHFAGVAALRTILKFRAVDGDAAARDTLRSPLSRPCGPDEVRLDLDRWLEGRGFVEAGQPRDLLLRDEIKQLDLRAARLHTVQR
jgi:hypothetical protein